MPLAFFLTPKPQNPAKFKSISPSNIVLKVVSFLLFVKFIFFNSLKSMLFFMNPRIPSFHQTLDLLKLLIRDNVCVLGSWHRPIIAPFFLCLKQFLWTSLDAVSLIINLFVFRNLILDHYLNLKTLSIILILKRNRRTAKFERFLKLVNAEAELFFVYLEATFFLVNVLLSNAKFFKKRY